MMICLLRGGTGLGCVLHEHQHGVFGLGICDDLKRAGNEHQWQP